MDHQQNKQRRRVSFSDLLQEEDENSIKMSKDITKSKSFHAALDDKSIAKIARDYKDSDSEFAATIAAATYAIHSLDETRAEYERLMVRSFRESFRDPPIKPSTTKNDQQRTLELPNLGSKNRTSRINSKSVGEGRMRSSTRNVEVEGPMHRVGTKGQETKANAWELARIANINNWYEKMNRKILEWEKEKKKKASLDMEKRKAEVERKKRLNLNHYQNKIEWIENVCGGARRRLEEKKISEEAYVKQRATKIKSTATLPVQCFCFEY